MTDFLDEKRREINDRLKELKPAVDEYSRLEAAASALAAVGRAAPATTRTATPKAGRPPGSGKKAGRPPGSGKKVGRPAGKAGRSKGRVGRRKARGPRALQTLSLVQGQPGITIPELAAKMGIKQNYLYRVLPGLQREGIVAKRGGGWHPLAGWDEGPRDAFPPDDVWCPRHKCHHAPPPHPVP